MSDPDSVELPPQRFVPGEMRGQLVEAEHLVRYWWAAQLAADKRILDAGCGLAYGTELLMRAGASAATGVDVSAATVEAARAQVGDDVELARADVTALPFDSDSFDLVVCFEVIEHVAQPDRGLDELARVLAPGGILALSSPNRDEYPAGNPHHVHEYVPAELEASLRARFAHARLFRQQGWTTSAILDDHQFASGDLEALEMRTAKVSAGAPGRETYTVALSSTEPLPEMTSHAVMTAAVELRRWLALYDSQQEMLAAQASLLSVRSEREAELATLHQRLRVSQQDLAVVPQLRLTAEDAIRDRDDALRRLEDSEDLQARVQDLQRQLDVIVASSSWRITRPLRNAAALLRRR